MNIKDIAAMKKLLREKTLSTWFTNLLICFDNSRAESGESSDSSDSSDSCESSDSSDSLAQPSSPLEGEIERGLPLVPPVPPVPPVPLVPRNSIVLNDPKPNGYISCI